MHIATRSDAHKAVSAFVNHNHNYMKVDYSTEIRLRETIMTCLDRQVPEEDFWEMCTDICPAFCDFMSN